MNLRPLHDYVFIRRDDKEQLSLGGIVIPDSAAEKPVRGEVAAAGDGRRLENGKRIAPDVKPGDEVLFGKYSGTEVTVEKEKLIMMHETDILAVFEK
jgi:chaperonin GroES